jgi:hypothetical protein
MQLLAVTLRLLREYGYDRLSVDAVATQAKASIVLMPSTPFACPQVMSRRFAYSNSTFPQVIAIFGAGSIPGSPITQTGRLRTARSRGRAWINISSTSIGDPRTIRGRRLGARERGGRTAVAIIDS